MVFQGIQTFGIATALIGLLGVIVTLALPQWRVSALDENAAVISMTFWDGLWKSCVVTTMGLMQCSVYDWVLVLPFDVQAGFALTAISSLVGVLGTVLSVAGGRGINCIKYPQSKASKAYVVAGVLFVMSGLLFLIPVSWLAYSMIENFNNLFVPPSAKTEIFAMGRIAKEISGQILCFVGFVGVCLTTGLPMWRVTSFIGANIVTGQTVWDGLWMRCVMQATGQMQCSIQDSIMRLTQDLQAARALVIIAVVIGFVGMMLTFIGGRCSSCLKNESSMSKVVISGGVLCIVAGVVCLIPVCWSAAVTIQDFTSALTTETQKREIGASIYIGWASAGLLILGGALLSSSCPDDERKYRQPMYPYVQPGVYGPGTYMAPSKTYAPSMTYAGPGSYMPNKPYAAPSYAAPGRYL
ncbi:claudin-like protein ZF-A89 [Sardina pilchardus]|uniref:claudin-like protein ZF-A89 n=1 Tax=Sardina pilchardus TaxID=27697 RepID=UPI002E105917